MVLADKITEERKKNGWSQEELANQLGVSRQAVSKWESAGAVPDLQRILQMSELFCVSTDYLLKDEMKAEAAKQGNWFQRAIRTFGDVFVPILPAIVATGLFMGIRGAIAQDQVLALFGTTADAFKSTDFYTYSTILTDTAFAFFPALISWSASVSYTHLTLPTIA